jgi:hypothetical protein
MAQATQFNQAMPIAGVAGQTGSFQHQHDPDLAQADLGDQALKAGARRGAPARTPLVLIDHGNRRGRPPQLQGTFLQPVLPLGTFLVFAHLLASVDCRT